MLKDPKQRRFFKSNNLYELFTLNSPDGTEGTETSAIFAGMPKEELKHIEGRWEGRGNRLMMVMYCISGTGSVVPATKRKLKHQVGNLSEVPKTCSPCKEQSSPKLSKLCESFPAAEHAKSPTAAVESAEKNKGNPEKLSWTSSSPKDDAQTTAVNVANSLTSVEKQYSETAEGLPFRTHQGRKGASVNVDGWNSLPVGEGLGSIEGQQKLVYEKNSQFREPAGSAANEPSDSSHNKHTSKTKHLSPGLEGRKGRSKKARHPHGAKFEGVRIPHLVKQRKYRREDKEDEKNPQENDDYVLKKLFKKSGNSACASFALDHG